ncbi:MAG: COX15/CtaA family protein [Nocardioidaceae bacterium]
MGVTRELTPDRSHAVRRRGPERILAWSPSRQVMRGLAVASLCANIVLVVTGGAVRLTGSGLGCPTWPRCTAESFVAHDALGVNGFIEFGNRMLTFVLAAIAVATWVAAMRLRPARSSLRWLATVLLLAIPAQAVVGGVTVLTHLNPWVVSLHLLSSLAVIAVAVWLVRRIDEPDVPSVSAVPSGVAWLARCTFAAAWLVLYVGTVVTGSGPHAGSAEAPRNGLSPSSLSQLHADLVFLLIGLTAGTWLALRAADGPPNAQRAARWLLRLELAQGVVGFVQYATDLPVGLVAVHMLGAALVSAVAAWLLLAVRERPPRSAVGVVQQT